MNLRASTFLGLTLISATSFQPVQAGDMYLSLFYGSAPVSDAEVTINGVAAGRTNAQGALEYDVTSGEYKLAIGAGDKDLANFSFEIDDKDQNIDIKVDASGAEEPVIALDKYFPGDTDGPVGTIRGKIVDWMRFPVANATVKIPELGVETYTDTSGEFELIVPRGTRYVQISHPSAGAATDADVRVVANAGVDLAIKLLPAIASTAGEIEETVVVAKAYNSNSLDTVALEYDSMTVTDALDFIQIQRYGDSNVAAAVKRVVGVTVRDGKYAIIRGLEGRYIGTTLNGAMIPSTDPQRRDAELDLFPSDILENLEVQKGFTADQLGDSSAGALKINTKSMPDARVFKLSLSAKHRDGVTGDDVLDYEGSETDGAGYDDGFRDLPTGVRTAINSLQTARIQNQPDPDFSNEELITYAQSLTNVYNTRTEEADLGYDFGLVYGDVFDLENSEIGFYGVVSYASDTEARQDYDYSDGIGNVATVRSQSRTERNYDWSGYFAGGWNTDNMELSSKTIFLKQTQDLITRQVEIDRGDDDREFDKTILSWTEREFTSQQFEGNHFINDTNTLNWSITQSRTERSQPDRREYTYDNGRLDITPFERRWSDLQDDALNLRADYTLNLDVSDDIFTTVKVGVMKNTIDREVDVARVGIDTISSADSDAIEQFWNVTDARLLDPETLFIGDNFELINNNGDLALQLRLDATEDTASYDSETETNAYYLSTETEIGSMFTVIAGVRQEEYTQEFSFPFSSTQVPDLASDEALASLGANFKPNDSWVFRVAYSNTLSYPGITERSPSIIYDAQTQLPIIGEPNLKVSELDNYDLRAEYYFNEGLSSVSLAFFYKDILNPIERALGDGSGGIGDSITFRNNTSAEVSGIELDANVQLFSGESFEGFVAGNVAYTDSETILDEDSARLEGIEKRQLQGLSPYVANIQFGLDHLESAQNFTIVLNYFDDRIDRAEKGRAKRPIYEIGRLDLGVNYSKEFEFGGKISLKLSNLTDEEVRYEGESSSRQVIFYETYKKGRTVSLGYSQSF